MTDTMKTKREEMQALKLEMQSDQRDAANALCVLVADFGKKIEALREQTIPGEVVEQSIDNVLGMTTQVPIWVKHIVDMSLEGDVEIEPGNDPADPAIMAASAVDKQA